METVLELDNVTKVFRAWDGSEFTAVDGVSLRLEKGRLLGILGPNGAGKTTLLRMLYAHWPPTSGRLRVLGMDPQVDDKKLKARLGVTPQENNLDPDFNVQRNLLVYARYFRIPRDEAKRRTTELLAFVGLTEKTRSDIDSLSGGMKRRLVLARSLINDPDFILLDEPTTGLDPQARHLVWEKIRALRREGKTILLTTHYMDEAERLCDEIVIMDKGKIHERGTPTELIQRHAAKEVLEVAFEETKAPTREVLRSWPGFGEADVDVVGDRAFVYSANAEALQRVAKDRPDVQGTTVRRGTLEDVFLRVTGRELQE